MCINHSCAMAEKKGQKHIKDRKAKIFAIKNEEREKKEQQQQQKSIANIRKVSRKHRKHNVYRIETGLIDM